MVVIARRYEIGKKIDFKFSDSTPTFFAEVYKVSHEKRIGQIEDKSVKGLGKKIFEQIPPNWVDGDYIKSIGDLTINQHGLGKLPLEEKELIAFYWALKQAENRVD